ncbi:MAG TPA: TolC family protein [Chryseosolibacter sp.]
MTKVTYVVIFTTILIISTANAQTGIHRVLADVERNNKSLASGKQYREAQNILYKIGLNPENPKIEYDYLPGRPEGAGTQEDFSVTQGFDFPTSYAKRRSVANEQIVKAELEFQAERQRILLETKLVCIDLIYRKKLESELSKRMKNANTLLEAITRQTQQGESSILDLNKVKLLQLEIKNQADLNVTTLTTLQQKLDELNGGIPLDLSALDYPLLQAIAPFETLDSLIEANDPEVKVISQQKEISQEQVALSRSITLPKFEGGFHQQSILGQKYQGFHVGMTIPLWENKNRVKSENARLLFSEFQIAEHRTMHHYKNKQLYEQYLHWQNTFAEYRQILGSANNEELLNKALSAGQVSLIEYLMEVRYFYDAIVRSLEAEKALHDLAAQLYKFQL